jgi:SNF2 family DNA or RNA helicase
LGGLLADDMGLGKSLVMIAAIVTSIPDAQKFVAAKVIGQKPHTSATLVIVPSARQSQLLTANFSTWTEIFACSSARWLGQRKQKVSPLIAVFHQCR